MDWYCLGINAGFLTSAEREAAWIILPSVLRENLTDPTVVRTRWNISWRHAVGSQNIAGFGVIAWSDRDDIVDEPPGPLTDCHLDWIIHTVFSVPTGTTAGTLLTLDDAFVDSRAMRKLGNTQSLLFCAESSSLSSGNQDYVAYVRCLIKE